MTAAVEMPDQAARFPNVPASITLSYLKMWLGLLGLPLDGLMAGDEDMPSIRIFKGCIEVHYYALDERGRMVSTGTSNKAATHTITIPVTE